MTFNAILPVGRTLAVANRYACEIGDGVGVGSEQPDQHFVIDRGHFADGLIRRKAGQPRFHSAKFSEHRGKQR